MSVNRGERCDVERDPPRDLEDHGLGDPSPRRAAVKTSRVS